MKTSWKNDELQGEEKVPELMQVIALELDMYIDMNDESQIEETLGVLKHFESLKPDLKTAAIMKECEGKIKMNNQEWEAAMNEFWESFTRLAQCNDEKAQVLLQYVMFASILAQSQIDYLSHKLAESYTMNAQILDLRSLKEDFDAGRT